MRKSVVVTILVMILLLCLPPLTTNAQSCTSPGSGSSTDYPYDAAANTYVVCTILSAQATLMAAPTQTPDIYGCYKDQNAEAICLTMRQWTPTPTTMPTLNPTQIMVQSTATTIAAMTGCTYEGPYATPTNSFRSCVIEDSNARIDARTAWWAPLIVITLLATAVLRFKS